MLNENQHGLPTNNELEREREEREWLCKRIDHGDFLPTLKSISTTLLYVSCDTNSCNPNTENELTITILLTFKSLSTKLIYICFL
jgi:hypothetical protein